MNPWHSIEPGNFKALNVFIEIPKGSRNKYETDKNTGFIKLSRVLFSPFHYPFNYGFIPKTLAKDGDPLDCMVLGDELHPATIVEVRILGLLKITDEGKVDDKILTVPIHDPRFNEYRSIRHVPKHLLKEIQHFFTHYKDLESKKINVIRWLSGLAAKKEIKRALLRYKKEFYQDVL